MDTTAWGIAQLALRIVIAAVFILMGVNHFRRGPMRAMTSMIPQAMRWNGLAYPRNLVLFTGACEIAGGIGLLIPCTQVAAAVCLVIFLAAVFPANAYAAAHKERFRALAIPLIPRLIGQILLATLIIISVL